MATSSVNCFGSSTSRLTSMNFLKSKLFYGFNKTVENAVRPNLKLKRLVTFLKFVYRDAISHRLQNFEKLEPSLRNLNIKFDSKMVDKIMKRERGLALRLLY